MNNTLKYFQFDFLCQLKIDMIDSIENNPENEYEEALL